MGIEKLEIEKLRNIELVSICNELGYIAKKEGGNYYRVKDKAINLVINTKENSFMENKAMRGGKGAIDLLTKVFNYDFKKAIKVLSSKEYKDLVNEKRKEIETKEKEYSFIAKKEEANTSRVIRYLCNTRGIEGKIVRELIKENRIYGDKNSNAVFVNEKKDCSFARGIIKEKGFTQIRGRPDFISFNFENKERKAYIFESTIDALSYKTLYPKKKGLYVTTGGAMMINRVGGLVEKEGIKKIVLCFDNDEQGRRFKEKVKEQLKEKKVEIFEHRPKNKDFNEDLVKIKRNKTIER